LVTRERFLIASRLCRRLARIVVLPSKSHPFSSWTKVRIPRTHCQSASRKDESTLGAVRRVADRVSRPLTASHDMVNVSANRCRVALPTHGSVLGIVWCNVWVEIHDALLNCCPTRRCAEWCSAGRCYLRQWAR
jgi:hypothetical protein